MIKSTNTTLLYKRDIENILKDIIDWNKNQDSYIHLDKTVDKILNLSRKFFVYK